MTQDSTAGAWGRMAHQKRVPSLRMFMSSTCTGLLALMASVSCATVAGSLSLPCRPYKCWKALRLGNTQHARETLRPDSRQWLGTSGCTTQSAEMLNEKQRPRSTARCSTNRLLHRGLPAEICSYGPIPHPHCSLSCVGTPAEPEGGCWYPKGASAVVLGTLHQCCVQAGCRGRVCGEGAPDCTRLWDCLPHWDS